MFSKIINVLKIFSNLKSYRAKSFKKNSERVIFGYRAGISPVTFS